MIIDPPTILKRQKLVGLFPSRSVRPHLRQKVLSRKGRNSCVNPIPEVILLLVRGAIPSTKRLSSVYLRPGSYRRVHSQNLLYFMTLAPSCERLPDPLRSPRTNL